MLLVYKLGLATQSTVSRLWLAYEGLCYWFINEGFATQSTVSRLWLAYEGLC